MGYGVMTADAQQSLQPYGRAFQRRAVQDGAVVNAATTTRENRSWESIPAVVGAREHDAAALQP